MLLYAQLGISIFGCTAFLLVTREDRRLQVAGVVFGLISNPFWWLMVVATEQWITVPVHLAYTYGWFSKAWRLWRSRMQIAPRWAGLQRASDELSNVTVHAVGEREPRNTNAG